MRIILDPRIGDWVAERAEQRFGVPFKDHAGLAVVSSTGKIMAGVVYDEYDQNNKTIQMSCAIDDPRCLTKNILRGLFSYPFENLKCYRVWYQTPHVNERLVKLSEILGFTKEAVLKNHFGQNHAVVGRMLYPTYRRLYLDEITKNTSRA